MKVIIEGDACIGSGCCVLECPEVFSQDPEEGTVVVTNPNPDSSLDDAVRNAAAACPASVITLEED
jgi:ferredoxin